MNGARDERLVWMVMRWRRWATGIACAPLALLIGCPQQQAATPGTTSAKATAPPIAATAQGTPPVQVAAVTAAQSADAAAKANKVRQLIGQVEGRYRSGVDNYRGNRLEAARSDFDFAVDLMLTSGMDLKSDPQLSDEFEHLINGINSLEMVALKQGNGFSPKLEEAPLENAEDLTFAPNPELTAKLKAELQTKSDLPLVINDQVAGYIGYFSNSSTFRAHMVHSLERGGKYRVIIQKALADQGLPQDLFYLAVAESGFQPQALNARSGAGGMWQFMPTGAYGLARNGYFDERFDPEKSSIAYAKYMKALYNQFGDWYLAMAAYDWGPGNIQKAVMRTGYADFWELYRRNSMPKETKAYVPQILAALIMAKNPVKYGLDKVVPEPAVVSDMVTVDYAIDLRLVADVTNASLPEIVALNPSLLRMTTPEDGGFDLHLPVDTKNVFLQRIKEIPEAKRSSWRFHVVSAGESLESIAGTLHARPAEIATANGLSSTGSIASGDELVVPVAAGSARSLRYVTRSGDTLVKIADRFNVSVEDIRRWNHLSSTAMKPHRTLDVSEPVRLAPVTHVRAKRSHAGQSGQRKITSTSSRSSSKSASNKKTAAKKKSKNAK